MVVRAESTKTLIIVGDGMADDPIPSLGGRTPLQVAETPHMDALARAGVVGRVRTVPAGLPPGSDIANLSLMGYDPALYYTGRAPLEAASMGIHLGERDLAFRCNLVTLAASAGGALMADYSGGGPATDRARKLIACLNERFETPDRAFHAGVSYRHLFVWRQAVERFRGVITTPPHDISGCPIRAHLPRGPGAGDLIRVMEDAAALLAAVDEGTAPPAPSPNPNGIWFWGQGAACLLPPLAERFGVRGATVCAVDLIKGLGRCAGMDHVRVPGATGDIDTNFQGKAVAAILALRDHDLVFLHVESPDEASHRGELAEKIRSIERLDREVVGTLRRALRAKGLPHRMLILPDHATPLATRTHSDQEIPFLLHLDPPSIPVHESLRLGRGGASVCGFDEREAEKSGVVVPHGHELLGRVLDRFSV